jgi:mono/diheme cytochrome c family protein
MLKAALVTAFVLCFALTPTLSEAGGAEVYRNACAMCHGQLGEGVSGLATGPAIKGNGYIINSDEESLEEFILEGRSGKAKRHKELLLPMLPQELTNGEVKAVIAYIKALARE